MSRFTALSRLMEVAWRRVLGLVALWFPLVSAAEVSWEIVNRFPLLSDAAFASIAREIGPDKTNIEVRLTQLDYRNTIKHLDGLRWDEKAQRYDRKKILSPSAQVKGSSGLGETPCEWTLEKQSVSAAPPQSAPCSASGAFEVEFGQTYVLKATRTSDGASEVSKEFKPTKRLIVAVGDSFSSGEGNPDYPAVFREFAAQPPFDWATGDYDAKRLRVVPAQWMDATCHRSIFAWSTLYALRQALTKPDTVIQYASFACSGAEVIDGFLLKQKNPPGTLGASAQKSNSYAEFPQQQALAEFLCGDQQIETKNIERIMELDSHRGRYGGLWPTLRTYSCKSPEPPAEVLAQFGGNDTGFSGVVKHVIKPPSLRYRGIGFVETAVNRGLYKIVAPKDPNTALEDVARLPHLYRVFQRGLVAAGIDPQTVKMPLYPDPTISAFEGDKRVEELLLCNARTRDGNRPFQSVISTNLGLAKNDSAVMGVIPRNLVDVKTIYIPALRQAQLDAISEHKWQPLDSTPAMVGFGVCAGTLECRDADAACANGDRVRWDYPKGQCVYSPDTPTWAQMRDFKAYDPTSRRGLRYANDALLAMARPDVNDKAGRIRLDWAAGAIHPTASVHARIASTVDVPLQNPSAASPKAEPLNASLLSPPNLERCKPS